MRKGIADLHRRAEVSEAANERYWNAREFTINGLRNRDLQALLWTTKAGSEAEARKRSARVSRLIRNAESAWVAEEVPHTHRYQVTDHGRKALTAIGTARRATVAELSKLAA